MVARTLAIFGLVGALVVAAGAPVAACGPDTDCEVAERSYRIAMPEGEVTGALIFAHGYRGSASGTMRNASLRAFAAANGLALVATQADGDDWRIPGVPAEPGTDGAAELAYHDAVIADLMARHGIPAGNLVMSGFSAGGMVTWFLACRRGERFRAFLPVAGTFWAPVPAASACPGYPVDLVHVHGLDDRIVPLGGRPIAATRQGEVPLALGRLRDAGAYGDPDAATAAAGDLSCRTGQNAAGRVLGFCTHPGGHSFQAAYLAAGLDVLRARGVFGQP